MENEFIPYKEASALMILGFKKPCLNNYSTENHPSLQPGILLGIKPDDPLMSSQMYKIGIWNIKAPLYQQAFSWFREKHNMLANVYPNASGFLFEYRDSIRGTYRFHSKFEGPNDSGCWDTYREAELACLKKLIKIIT